MDSFFASAKALASEAARKSQELASQTAKYSQDIASQTAKYSEQISKTPAFQDLAKRSQALAQEAARRSQQLAKEAAEKLPALAQQIEKSAEEGLQQLVKELQVSGSGEPGGSKPKGKALEEELEEYGVTEDLREFVRGLTIDTFKQFPVDEQLQQMREEAAVNAALTGPLQPASAVPLAEEQRAPAVDAAGVRHDLSDWQAQHALLVLRSVKEISEFRYQLCPRFLSEQRFWRVYFVLVHAHVRPYEERAEQRQREAAAAKAAAAQQALASAPPAATAAPSAPPSAAAASSAAAPAGAPATPAPPPAAAAAAAAASPKVDDSDIEALLMDALGGDDAVDDGEEFDVEDFDEFVKSAVEDDGQ